MCNQAKAGDIVEALANLSYMHLGIHRDRALSAIAIMQAEAGDIEKALETMSQLSFEDYRDEPLSAIAVT